MSAMAVIMRKFIQNIRMYIEGLCYGLIYPNLKHAFSINSHMTSAERIRLYKLADIDGFLLEIGSYVGASACCFAEAKKKESDKKIICIDTWNNNAMTEGVRDTWEEFQLNTGKFKDCIIPIRGYSTDVVDKVRSVTSNVGLLFIDGDHSYEGVKADWDAYKGFLGIGSVVIFHDYGWADGVKRVVHEEVLSLTSSHAQLPNMWWGTLSKKP